MFLDYSDKTESQPGHDYCPSEAAASVDEERRDQQQQQQQPAEDVDKLAVDLYRDVCDKLHEYPDLCSDLLLFLTPQQAAMINMSEEHTMLLKMTEFVNVTQMYFAKQPSRIGKVMQAITQMTSDAYITAENAQNIMGAALKGHPLVMDMFLQALPTLKPPDR